MSEGWLFDLIPFNLNLKLLLYVMFASVDGLSQELQLVPRGSVIKGKAYNGAYHVG